MQEAAALFVGDHDFSAFQAAGSAVQTTVRRIWTSTVEAGAAPAAVVRRRPTTAAAC